MRSPYYVQGTISGNEVVHSFIDLKSGVRWCTSHKGRNATFSIFYEDKKILTVTYKNPFHVITPANGTKMV